jgi:hypothetical protein
MQMKSGNSGEASCFLACLASIQVEVDETEEKVEECFSTNVAVK